MAFCHKGDQMKNYLVEAIKDHLSKVKEKDVYAFNLYLEYANDNPYQPTVTFGYNTIEHFTKTAQSEEEIEAKWDYAYWPQNELFVFGCDKTEKIVKDWMLAKGLGYMTYEEFFSEGFDENLPDKIDRKVKKELIDVVKEIHSLGLIKQHFGKELPIIIHELEYGDEIARINKRANPNALIKEFVFFCLGEA